MSYRVPNPAVLSPGVPEGYNEGTRHVIYVRSTGNDTTGDGTLANPYLTFPRAFLDVPSDVQPPDRYVIDATDYGDYVLPNDDPDNAYTLPPFNSSIGFAQSILTPDYLPFRIEGAVNIQAIPTQELAVPAANIISSTLIGPATQYAVLTNLVFVPQEHEGKFLINPTTGNVFVIYDNDVNTLYVQGGDPVLGDDLGIFVNSCVLIGSQLVSRMNATLVLNGIGFDGITFTAQNGPACSMFLCRCTGTYIEFSTIGGHGNFSNQGPQACSFADGFEVYVAGVPSYRFDSNVFIRQQLHLARGASGFVFDTHNYFKDSIFLVDEGNTTFVLSTDEMFEDQSDYFGENGMFVLKGLGRAVIQGPYFWGPGGEFIGAFDIQSGQIKITSALGTGFAIGDWQDDFGLLGVSPINNMALAPFIMALGCNIPGATADIQLGTLAPVTWANFYGANNGCLADTIITGTPATGAVLIGFP